MYSILCSKIESLGLYKNELKEIINPNSKVLIIPWSFANELDNLDEFF